jgi:hypothetical protein
MRDHARSHTFYAYIHTHPRLAYTSTSSQAPRCFFQVRTSEHALNAGRVPDLWKHGPHHNKSRPEQKLGES